ncbi:MAG: glycosyltransferase [Verrucomicrobia bacterium]|nr:glycosyltransferase [Verrucomicrobiota bacterium]
MIDPIGIWLWLSIAIVTVLLAQFLANLLVLRGLARIAPPGNGPLVSVLVPARNEAARIRPCLEALQLQDYPNLEVLVLDDNSTDNTADIVGSTGFTVARESRYRLVRGSVLPEGWVGKSWACQQLADASAGEYLMFVDADTVHSAGTVSSAINAAKRYRADLLTVLPYQTTKTFGEKLVIPLLFVVGGSYLPHWLVVLAQQAPWLARFLGPDFLAGCGTAIGQFLLFKRDSYYQLGGHASVATHLVEDVTLGRRVAKRIPEGWRLITCDGTGLVQCRMYSSLGDIWEGFTKNLWPVFDGDRVRFWFAVVWQAAVLVLPFALVPFLHRPELYVLVLLILVLRAMAACRFRTSWISVLCHPLGYGLALFIAVNSLRRSKGKGVKWKERVYRDRCRQSRPAEAEEVGKT